MCNCICKLFDVILMKKCDKVLHTSDQQFAFKQKHSTAVCSSVLIETVNYFVKGGSNVYGCFLDASKAFDKSIMEICSVYWCRKVYLMWLYGLF